MKKKKKSPYILHGKSLAEWGKIPKIFTSTLLLNIHKSGNHIREGTSFYNWLFNRDINVCIYVPYILHLHIVFVCIYTCLSFKFCICADHLSWWPMHQTAWLESSVTKHRRCDIVAGEYSTGPLDTFCMISMKQHSNISTSKYILFFFLEKVLNNSQKM